MVALTQQEKDVVERFQRLPAERRREVMLAMYRTDPGRWRHYQRQGEKRLRELAEKRGVDWDALDDDQRQDFSNNLVHEDRA